MMLKSKICTQNRLRQLYTSSLMDNKEEQLYRNGTSNCSNKVREIYS